MSGRYPAEKEDGSEPPARGIPGQDPRKAKDQRAFLPPGRAPRRQPTLNRGERCPEGEVADANRQEEVERGNRRQEDPLAVRRFRLGRRDEPEIEEGEPASDDVGREGALPDPRCRPVHNWIWGE